jgi:hypothetical protein
MAAKPGIAGLLSLADLDDSRRGAGTLACVGTENKGQARATILHLRSRHSILRDSLICDRYERSVSELH